MVGVYSRNERNEYNSFVEKFEGTRALEWENYNKQVLSKAVVGVGWNQMT
jgi:hypothetical protein